MENRQGEVIHDPRQAKRAAWGALAGSSIEWYDFYVYGTAAALVIGPVFFPDSDPVVKTTMALATFATGFLLRPLGAILFGFIGDRISRKQSLLLTLLIMGGSTTAIGLLPTYADIGATAAILLLFMRALQGLSVGGEWGGAVLVASEAAPKHRKALAASMAQIGAPIGSILSTLVFLAMPSTEFLLAGGWRIPFLLSAVLLVVGYIIRLKLEENPEFLAAKERREQSPAKQKAPLSTVLRHFPLVSLVVFVASFAVSGAYFRNVFALNWAVTHQGIERQTFLNALLIGAIIQIVLTPLGAMIADRFGVSKVQIAWTALYLVVAPFPMLALIATGRAEGVYIGVALAFVGHALYYATLSGYLSQLFPTELRFTGISLGYQLSGSLVSAFVPIVAVQLVGSGGDNILPAQIMYALLVGLSLLAVVIGPRLSRRETGRYEASRASHKDQVADKPVVQASV